MAKTSILQPVETVTLMRDVDVTPSPRPVRPGFDPSVALARAAAASEEIRAQREGLGRQREAASQAIEALHQEGVPHGVAERLVEDRLYSSGDLWQASEASPMPRGRQWVGDATKIGVNRLDIPVNEVADEAIRAEHRERRLLAEAERRQQREAAAPVMSVATAPEVVVPPVAATQVESVVVPASVAGNVGGTAVPASKIRKAGDPGVMERIAGFLGDNAYTQAWRNGVMSPVGMAERQLINDPVRLRELAAEIAADRLAAEVKEPGGYLGTPLAQEFERLTGMPDDLGSEDAFALPEGYRVGMGHELADAFSELSSEKARQVIEWSRQNPAGRRALTPIGAAIDLGLGNAAAAYGLPAAGAGLAAWGLHDVMAAQQQAEKESQLPLS